MPRGEVPARSSSFGQQGEHARRVAARGGRLADRQADLALGHREARDRVHHQHHVAALVAEVLGDRGRGERGLDAHERGLVGRRDDHDRAGHALRAEVALDELAHLAATLADQADDVHVGRRGAGDHAQQRRLADAGAGEDAEALAAAARHQRVERADAERDALVDARARQADRAGAASTDRDARQERRRAEPSSGRPRPSSVRPSRSSDTSTRSGAPLALTRAPGPMPGRLAERHQQRAAGAEADHLGGHGRAAAAGVDRADLADLGLEAGGLDDQADQVDDAAVAAMQVGIAQRRGRAVEGAAHDAGPERGLDDLAGAQQLGLDAGVDVAVGRPDDRAAAGHAALGLDLAVLDAAERRPHVVHRLADHLEVLGMDEHGHALALDDAAQRAADGLDDEFGLDGDRAADDLLGEEQRQVDGVRLEALGARELRRLHALGGLVQRLERRSERGERLLATLAQALLARGRPQQVGLGLGLRERRHDGVGAAGAATPAGRS